MALEVLKGVKEIGGFEIVDITEPVESEYCIKYLSLDLNVNCISFMLQKGPIKEVGFNGCQIDTIIEVAKLLIEKHNQHRPCYENVRALDSLKDALGFLAERRVKRSARGVEGTSEQ